jgi:hypothetical protein
MSFRRVLGVAIVLALVVSRAGGDDASPPPPQETVVHGTPPRIVGRWLALSWIDRSEAAASTMPALWQITEQDGKPVFTEVFAKLPETIQSAVDMAGNSDNPWTPTPADLSTLREQWEKLQPQEANFKSVWTEIASPDGYDDGIKKEPRTKDALWVVRQRFDANAKAAPVVRQVFVYAVTGTEDGSFKGNFDGVTIAAAPMPVPIKLSGSFRLYQIDGPPPGSPSRGVLARLLDVFRGCGR